VWDIDEKQAEEFKMWESEICVERKGPAGNCLANIARRAREDIPVDRLLFCLHQPFV